MPGKTKQQLKSKYHTHKKEGGERENKRIPQTLTLVIQISGWFELESHRKERGNQYLNQDNNSDIFVILGDLRFNPTFLVWTEKPWT